MPLTAWTAYFLRLGTLGFGGPIALAAAMHRDLVDERRWVTAEEYKEEASARTTRAMCVVEGVGQFRQNPRCFGDRELTVWASRWRNVPLNIRHDVIDEAIAVARVEKAGG